MTLTGKRLLRVFRFGMEAQEYQENENLDFLLK
jgi:hypothetical protein